MHIHSMNILMVDNDESQLDNLKKQLSSEGFQNLTSLPEAYLIQAYLLTSEVDLICLKINTDRLDALEVLSRFKASQDYKALPIVILLEAKDAKYQQVAYGKGANDVLIAPYTHIEYRMRNLLESRQSFKQLEREKNALKESNKDSIAKLERTQIEMLVRLAHAAEYRDDESGEHVWRVAHTSWLLALELGLSSDKAELILRAARLHDVGKIGIPDGILRKPAKLTAAEFEIVKQHTLIGAQLLAGGESDLLRMAESIALTHHERWDGTGYPKGLRAENIPIEGRILAIADTFDALCSDRVHQKAWPARKALEEIKSLGGKHFDPRLVDAFVDLYEAGVLPYDFSKQPYDQEAMDVNRGLNP